MKPTFPSISIINITIQEKYNVNDIIVFNNKYGLKVCHRIIKIDNNVFTTKGDNRKISKKHETNLPIINIIGKVEENYNGS